MNRIVKGIVLRQVQYKEKDCMVSALTEEGIISFLARGILSPSSKNASSCLLYNYSEFTLSYKQDKITLTQGKSIKTFSKLYSSLSAISIASFMGETTLKFMDSDNRFIFNYFLNALYALEEDFDGATILAIFLAKIIKYSGYSLNYSECVKCSSKKEIVMVDYSEGGFLCSKCVNKYIDQTADYLKSFRYVFMVDQDNIKHAKLKEDISIRLINEFSNYLCDCFDVPKLNSLDLFNRAKNK